MNASLSFRCPACQARIKAPVQLIGQARTCPGCGHRLIVPVRAPEQSGPVLVFDDRPRVAEDGWAR
jgi:DNA-directed RNA polymerase subunit RPC12/RpoP